MDELKIDELKIDELKIDELKTDELKTDELKTIVVLELLREVVQLSIHLTIASSVGQL